MPLSVTSDCSLCTFCDRHDYSEQMSS